MDGGEAGSHATGEGADNLVLEEEDEASMACKLADAPSAPICTGVCFAHSPVAKHQNTILSSSCLQANTAMSDMASALAKLVSYASQVPAALWA